MDWLTPEDPDELARLLEARASGVGPLLPTGAPAGGGSAWDGGADAAAGGAGGGEPPSLESSIRGAGDAGAGRTGGESPGAGPRPVGPQADEAHDVLSTAALSGILELRPRDLTVTVGAGTRVGRLKEELREEGCWVALGGEALTRSVGGAVAAAPPGPLDAAYGDLQRQLLACDMVTWRGERARWGRGVMKNVAGYGVLRAVAGAFDRLGVVHRATFRLWPAPEEDRRLLLVPAEHAGAGDGGGSAEGGGAAADGSGDGADDRGAAPGGAGPLLALANAVAASDFDAAVRPDAVTLLLPGPPAARRTRPPSGGTRRGLEVRLVGTADSVDLRTERLRAWAEERGARVEEATGDGRSGEDPPAGDAGMADAGAGTSGGGADAAESAAARPPRPLDRSVVVLRPGRRGLADTAARAARAAGDDLAWIRGHPLSGTLRVCYRRPGDVGADDADGAAETLTRLLEAGGGVGLRVERGTAAELEAARRARPEAATRLEERVVEALGGRPRHWLSAFL